jgi:hypothetical protein
MIYYCAMIHAYVCVFFLCYVPVFVNLSVLMSVSLVSVCVLFIKYIHNQIIVCDLCILLLCMLFQHINCYVIVKMLICLCTDWMPFASSFVLLFKICYLLICICVCIICLQFNILVYVSSIPVSVCLIFVYTCYTVFLASM